MCTNCGLKKSKRSLYSLSTTEALTIVDITSIFINPYVVFSHKRDFAYPNLSESKNKQLPAIKFHDQLYYVNSMESIASNFEMQIINA